MYSPSRRGKVRLLCALLAAVLLAFTVPALRTGVGRADALSRSACISEELYSGTVLQESNADVALPMASTTKIMTALLICEDCDLDRVVIVPDCAVGVEGSSIYLKKGEEIDVRDLLYGLMLRSGNDSATALAVIHSGSVDKFTDDMNARALELGAKSTHFTNPSGLPDDDHYTTARDLCAIARAAMQNDIFRKVVGTKNWNGAYRSYSNKNKMLYNYDGATGVKTGYTLKAGRCLVSSAMRGGMEIVTVVLNEYDMYGKSAALLDYGFENYEVAVLPVSRVFLCGGRLCSPGAEGRIVLRKGSELSYACRPKKGPSGKEVGELEIYCQNDLIFSAILYSIV